MGKPLVLAVLDGWGIAPDEPGNAVTQAQTPNIDLFSREYPAMTLYASGNEVGLGRGDMGNSEVGHLNIGAGRVYYQTLPRLNKSIGDGTFFENEAFLKAAAHAKEDKSAFHIIGLISPGNVHAAQDHCYAMLEFAKQQKIKHVYVHVILDGRDAQYNSGRDFVEQLEAKMDEVGVGEIATLSGRYFTMDRDNRWDRVEKAYRAMVDGVADQYAKHALEAIDASYAAQVYDEEFIPTVIGKEGKPKAVIKDGDAVVFLNFRPDRARQITKAFALPAFEKFQRAYMQNLLFVTMTEYEKEVPVIVAYPPVVVHNCLAEVVSKAGLKQIHIAETEKYAHVTFFMNGTVEDPFEGEDRALVPSPRVSSYDQAPEMSAAQVTKKVVEAIDKQEHDLIIVNFANADMVGHTGSFEATKLGIEAIDRALGAVAEHVLANEGVLMITADHGNAEEVANLSTGERDKEHSTNPVPLYVIAHHLRGQAGPGGDPPEGDLSLLPPVGMLADVAPTVLSLLGVPQPPDMTGRALL